MLRTTTAGIAPTATTPGPAALPPASASASASATAATAAAAAAATAPAATAPAATAIADATAAAINTSDGGRGAQAAEASSDLFGEVAPALALGVSLACELELCALDAPG